MNSKERPWVQLPDSRPRPDRVIRPSFQLEPGRPFLKLSLRILLATAFLTSAAVWGDDLVRESAAVITAAHREVVSASHEFLLKLQDQGHPSAAYEIPPEWAPELLPTLPPLPPTPTIQVVSPFPDYYDLVFPAGWEALEGGAVCPTDMMNVPDSNGCNFVIPPPEAELHEYYIRLYAQQQGISLPFPFAPLPTETPPTPDPFAGPPGATITHDDLGRPVWVNPTQTDAYGRLLILGPAGPNPYPEYPYGSVLGGGIFPSSDSSGADNQLAACPPGQVPLGHRDESPPGSGAGAGDCVDIGAFCRTTREAPGRIDADGDCDGNADTGTLREATHGAKSLLQDMNILR